MKKLLIFFIAGALGLIMTSCGNDGGGNTSNITMGATVLANKQVVASVQKTNALDWMWAFLSGNEANATHILGCDHGKLFSILGGSVCIEKAYVVFDEIEVERDESSSGAEDEVEFGPFVVDLAGFPGDGIPGEITIPVPVGVFDELKFKVDDLDDDDNDGLKVEDSGSSDDIPVNVSLANAIAAGLTKRSIRITGSATDGITTRSFDFFSDIEAKIKIPFTSNVLNGKSLIAFFDLTTGFGKLGFSDIAATMDGTMGSKKCSDSPLSKPQQLACDIVKNIDLFEDVDNDNVAEAGEDRGDDKGAGGFDDTQPHD